MRRSLTKFPSPSSSSISNFIPFTSSYSSSSRSGRGRGFVPPNFNFTKDNDSHPEYPSPSLENNPSPPVFGHGHGAGGGGHGKPFASPQALPPSSFFAAKPGPGQDRGLGLGIGSNGPMTLQPTKPPPAPSSDPTRKPVRINDSQTASVPGRPRNPEETHIPTSVMSVLSPGVGRGKIPNLSPSLGPSIKPNEENRHIRARQLQEGREDVIVRQPQQQRLSQEEAVKKAVAILSRDGHAVAPSRSGRGGGPSGGRGRGRGLQGRREGRGGGRGRGGQRGRSSQDAVDDDDGSGLYPGNDGDGEKLAQRLGPDINNQLVAAFEDMSFRVLPSPVDETRMPSVPS